jgi:small subunit ribosomal protein S10
VCCVYGKYRPRTYIFISQSSSDELVPERLYTKVNIKVKGADYAVLDSYCRYVITAGNALGVNIGGRVALPTRIQKFTVLKSPHIYKKHRVQYEIRTHSRLMQVKHITGTTADLFLEYIQRNLPEGVDMSVYQEQLDSLPAMLTGPPEGEEATTVTAEGPASGKRNKRRYTSSY